MLLRWPVLYFERWAKSKHISVIPASLNVWKHDRYCWRSINCHLRCVTRIMTLKKMLCWNSEIWKWHFPTSAKNSAILCYWHEYKHINRFHSKPRQNKIWKHTSVLLIEAFRMNIWDVQVKPANDRTDPINSDIRPYAVCFKPQVNAFAPHACWAHWTTTPLLFCQKIQYGAVMTRSIFPKHVQKAPFISPVSAR